MVCLHQAKKFQNDQFLQGLFQVQTLTSLITLYGAF